MQHASCWSTVFIVTPFVWDASPLQVTPHCFFKLSKQFIGARLVYTGVGEVMHCKGKDSVLSKKRMQ